MLLSEAILLGSVSTKQSFGSLRTRDNRTCALGAACEAVGINIEPQDWHSHLLTVVITQPLVDLFPILMSRVPIPNELKCWVPGDDGPMPMREIIWRLNDFLKWPRPQIAEWVASVEAASIPSMPEPRKEDVMK